MWILCIPYWILFNKSKGMTKRPETLLWNAHYGKRKSQNEKNTRLQWKTLKRMESKEKMRRNNNNTNNKSRNCTIKSTYVYTLWDELMKSNNSIFSRNQPICQRQNVNCVTQYRSGLQLFANNRRTKKNENEWVHALDAFSIYCSAKLCLNEERKKSQ